MIKDIMTANEEVLPNSTEMAVQLGYEPVVHCKSCQLCLR